MGGDKRIIIGNTSKTVNSNSSTKASLKQMSSQLLSLIPQIINLNTDEVEEGEPTKHQATTTAGYDQSMMDEKYFTGQVVDVEKPIEIIHRNFNCHLMQQISRSNNRSCKDIVFKDCHDEPEDLAGASFYPSCDLRETETVDNRQRRIGLLAMKETASARRERFECSTRELCQDYETNRP